MRKKLLLICGLLALGYGTSVIMREFLRGPTPAGNPLALGTAATVLAEPMEMPEFSLQDHHGAAFTRARLRGAWTFVFFGYTHCPDICPTTLTSLKQARATLRRASVEPLPAAVFVSVDPERDTLAHLAEYVTYFDREFLGVTGAADALRALTGPLGIEFGYGVPHGANADYEVGHSAAVLLIDPQARLRALLSPPYEPAAIAADYRKIIAAVGTGHP